MNYNFIAIGFLSFFYISQGYSNDAICENAYNSFINGGTNVFKKELEGHTDSTDKEEKGKYSGVYTSSFFDVKVPPSGKILDVVRNFLISKKCGNFIFDQNEGVRRRCKAKCNDVVGYSANIHGEKEEKSLDGIIITVGKDISGNNSYFIFNLYPDKESIRK